MLRKYLQVKSYESKCLKILSKFFHRFSGPGELRRLLSHTYENLNTTVPIRCLHSLKISIFYLKPFWVQVPDNETLEIWQNRLYLATGSDVIKTKKLPSGFYHFTSVLKISSKSVEPSSRNRVHKIGKKKKNNNNREKETIE